MNRPPILILGCERSGSTWLLNIFDSSPLTLCYMEPFADYASLFPGFPHRFHYLSRKDHFQAGWVGDRLSKLHHVKFGFFYKPGKSIYFRALDEAYLSFLNRVANILKVGPSKKIEQFQLLNLNQIVFKKQPVRNCEQLVIKELRLNFKVSLISSLFPDATVILAIRNPILQIDSILKRFRKNNLSELKRNLLFFESYLSQNKRFEKYKDLLINFSSRKQVEQLAIYWLINYNTLIEDLDDYGVEYVIANNDQISLSPEKEIQRILNDCKIEIGPEIESYLKSSSRLDSNKSDRIGTNRESAKYYRDLVSQIDPQFEKEVMSLIYHRLDFRIHKILEL